MELNNPHVQKAAEIRNFVSNLRPLSNNSSLSTSNRDGNITRKYKDISGKTKGINLEDVQLQEQATEDILKRSKQSRERMQFKSCER